MVVTVQISSRVTKFVIVGVKKTLQLPSPFGFETKGSFWFCWLSAQFVQSVCFYFKDIFCDFPFFPDFHGVAFWSVSVLRHVHLFLV